MCTPVQTAKSGNRYYKEKLRYRFGFKVQLFGGDECPG